MTPEQLLLIAQAKRKRAEAEAAASGTAPVQQTPARPAMDPLHMVNPAARAQVQANQPMRSLPMSPLGPGNERYAPPKPPPQGDPLAPANPQAAAANVDAQQRARGLVPYTNASTGETYWRPDPARQVADANAQFRAREAAKASAAQAQAENEAFRNSRPEIVNQASDAIRGGFAATENAAFDAVDAGLDAVDPRRKVSQFISQNITPAAEQVGRGIGDFVEGPSGRFGGMAGPAVGAITGGLSELGATMARDPQDASTQIVDALEPTHMLARGVNTSGDALDAAMGGDFGRSGNLMAQAVPDLIGGSGVLPAMSVTANALRTAARAPQRELAEQLARIQPLPATGRVPMAAPRAAASVGGAGGPPPAAPAAPTLPVPVSPQTAQQAPTAQAGSAIDDVDRARFESWADKATFTELYRALDNAAEIEAKGGLPDDIAYAKARAEAAQRAIDAENAKRVAEGLAPRVRAAQQAPTQPQTATAPPVPPIPPNAPAVTAGAAQPIQPATAVSSLGEAEVWYNALPQKTRESILRTMTSSGVRDRADQFAIIADLNSLPPGRNSQNAFLISQKWGERYPSLRENLLNMGGEFSATNPRANDQKVLGVFGKGRDDRAQALMDTEGRKQVVSERGFLERSAETNFGKPSAEVAQQLKDELSGLGKRYTTLLDPTRKRQFKDPTKIAGLQEAESNLKSYLKQPWIIDNMPEAVRNRLMVDASDEIRQLGWSAEDLRTMAGPTRQMLAPLFEASGPLPWSPKMWEAIAEQYPRFAAHVLQSSYAKTARDLSRGINAGENAGTIGQLGRMRGMDKDGKVIAGGLLDRLEKTMPNSDFSSTGAGSYADTRVNYGDVKGAQEALKELENFKTAAQRGENVADIIEKMDSFSPRQKEAALSQITAFVHDSMGAKVRNVTPGQVGMAAETAPNLTQLGNDNFLAALRKVFGDQGDALANDIELARSSTTFNTDMNRRIGPNTQLKQENVRNAPRAYEDPAGLEGNVVDSTVKLAGAAGLGAAATGQTGAAAMLAATAALQAAWNGYKRGKRLNNTERSLLADFFFRSREAGLDGEALLARAGDAPPRSPNLPSPAGYAGNVAFGAGVGGAGAAFGSGGDPDTTIQGMMIGAVGGGARALQRSARAKSSIIKPRPANGLRNGPASPPAGPRPLPGQTSNASPAVTGALVGGAAGYAAAPEDQKGLGLVAGAVGGGVVGSRFGKGAKPKAPPAKPAFDQRFMKEAQRLVSYNGGVKPAVKAQQYVIDQLVKNNASQDRINKAVSVRSAIERMAERSNRELDEIAATAPRSGPPGVKPPPVKMGIADNLKQDAALAAFGSAGGSFANQDDPQAGALGGMGLALGGKYGPRLANAMRGAGRVKPPPVRGVDQGKFRGPNNQTFAGVNAKTADKVALARAQNMEAEGASREEIIDATGWFKQHGQWKFEIIDSGAKLTGNKSGPLGSVMEHPELYKAYPDLAELNTTRTPWKTGGDYIAPSVFNDEMIRVGNVGDDARSIALHEAGGHGVQRRENFPSGASSKLSVAEHRQALSDDLEDTKYWLERHRSEGATASEIRAAEDRVAQLEAQFDATRNLTPTQFYRNTAGEVEARNVQKRDEIRRRGKNPGRAWETQDVPDDQQIVRFGSGKAESRPKPPPAKGPPKKPKPVEARRAAPRANNPFRDPRLTPGENKTAEMILNGYSYDEIADEMMTSRDVVKTQASAAQRKLGTDVQLPRPGGGKRPEGSTKKEAAEALFEEADARGENPDHHAIAQRTGLPVGTVKSYKTYWKQKKSAPVASADGAMYNPPAMPERPFEADYPQSRWPDGPPVDAEGRLTRDMDRRPLDQTSVIIGRNKAPGYGPKSEADRSLRDRIAVIQTLKKAGSSLERVPRSPDKANGSWAPTFDANGRLTGRGSVQIADDLDRPIVGLDDQEVTTLSHELAHSIDFKASPARNPNTYNNREWGIDHKNPHMPSKLKAEYESQLERIYTDLNNPVGGEVRIRTPKDHGYEAIDADRELWAEAIRAYMYDPNYIKTVAPDVAFLIRDFVNRNKSLRKTIQFNAAPTIMGLGGLGLGAAALNGQPAEAKER